MKVLKSARVFLFVLLTLAPCFAHHMAVVVSKDNTVDGVTSVNLSKIFKAESKKWPDGRNIVLVLHQQSPSELATLERLNKVTEPELKAFIASHKDGVYFAVSDADVLRLVGTIPGAIGLVEVRSINDKVKVLKVDGKLPLEEGYLPH
jgi:ABC-type phosphate transport system substrate-binding protein